MKLFFKNYDNGWKWVKMIGGCMFVAFLIRVIQYDIYAQKYNVTLLEIMGSNSYELALVFIGLVLYIFGKWMNYSRELLSILGVQKYSEVDIQMDKLRVEIYDKLSDETERKKFLDTYDSMDQKLKQAIYLKSLKHKLTRPQWLTNN